MKNEIIPVKGLGLHFITNEESSNLQDRFFIFQNASGQNVKQWSGSRLTTMTLQSAQIHWRLSSDTGQTEGKQSCLFWKPFCSCCHMCLLLFSHKANSEASNPPFILSLHSDSLKHDATFKYMSLLSQCTSF